MKNNSSNDKVDGSLDVKLQPLLTDVEYRKERQQEAALVDPTGEQKIGNNENNEAPDNVGGAEPTPNSETNNSNDVPNATYNPKTWQMFHDL